MVFTRRFGARSLVSRPSDIEKVGRKNYNCAPTSKKVVKGGGGGGGYAGERRRGKGHKRTYTYVCVYTCACVCVLRRSGDGGKRNEDESGGVEGERKKRFPWPTPETCPRYLYTHLRRCCLDTITDKSLWLSIYRSRYTPVYKRAISLVEPIKAYSSYTSN